MRSKTSDVSLDLLVSRKNYFKGLHLRVRAYLMSEESFLDFSDLCNPIFFSLSGDLSWRDVQHIIVRTARTGPVNIKDGDWNINKAGFKGKCLNCVLTQVLSPNLYEPLCLL